MFQSTSKQTILNLIQWGKNNHNYPGFDTFYTSFEKLVSEYASDISIPLAYLCKQNYVFNLNFTNEINELAFINYNIDNIILAIQNNVEDLAVHTQVPLSHINIDFDFKQQELKRIESDIDPIIISYVHHDSNHGIQFPFKAIDGNHRLFNQKQRGENAALCYVLNNAQLTFEYFTDSNSFFIHHFVTMITELLYLNKFEKK